MRSGGRLPNTEHLVTKGGDNTDSNAASVRPTEGRRRQRLHVFPLRRVDSAAKSSLQALDLPISRLTGKVNPARKNDLPS